MNVLESCQSLTLVMNQSLHLEINDFGVDDTLFALKPTREVLAVQLCKHICPHRMNKSLPQIHSHRGLILC